MAFGSITWNGTGVIANCDGLSDSVGGTWAELGGGGISYNTDQYLTGAGSIGHVYASKSGFGYYTTNTTYDFGISGTEEGQFIYIWINISSSSAFDTLANNGFSFVVGTDTSNYRTYKLAGSGIGENNGWSTGWKLFVFDPTVAGSIADTGTFNLSTINMIGLWMDTIVSVRADTIFIDQVAIAKGLRVKDGIGTMDDIVTYCAKTLGTRAWGVFQYKGRFFYSAGSLTVGDNTTATANAELTSGGSIVGYEISEFYHDTNGWSLTHPIDYNKIILEKNASYTTDYTATNTGLFGSIDATLSITNETGSTLNYSGGSFEELSATIMNSDQNITNAILTDCSTRSINGGIFDNNTVNTSDTITASASGSFSGNNIYKSIGTISVITADLAYSDNNNFTSDGSNHAIELTSIGDGTMDWNCSTNDYDTGATGSPITPTSTGNEDIYITATSASDITISVATGSTIPSVRVAASYTGSINVVAGQVTTTITVRDKQTKAVIQNARVYIYAGSGGGLTEGTIIINKVLTDINGQVSDTRSLSSDQPILGRARYASISPYYKTEPVGATISSSNGLALTLYMISDD